ncbi:VapE domain-containing protein, partial [Bacteroides sp. 519]|uniref:VapE domain-containing protein n=1 Tax=Bacteroides sp. 519 TaxID=2302937 RepID=UPI0019402FFE
YYTDSIDFSRKRDAELYLNRFALINIDEFDQISPTQQGFLKHILQKPVVNVRKPYANAVLEMQRYASFIATSNQMDLLTDPSGSRRFICIEVIGVIDTGPIDYNQLYAQAMHEIDNGERYWFNQQEEQIMTEHNRDFEQIPAEEQLFDRYFRIAENDDEGKWLSPAEILEKLKMPLSPGKVRMFGRILRKHGIPFKRTRFGIFYHVVERDE